MTFLKEKKNVVLLILGVLAISLFMIFVVTVVSIFLFYPHRRTFNFQESYTYKFTEISHSDDRTSEGFVKLTRNMMEEEYISYVNPSTGSTFFISNFGGTEYQCTGSCYCEKGNERRFASTSTLSRGLFVLLSAFSVALAYEMATESFRNNCIQKFSDVCDEEDVVSDVEDCEEMARIIKENVDNVEKEEIEKIDDFDDEKEYYDCQGRCLYNYMFNAMSLPFEIEDIGPQNWDLMCKMVEMEQRISLPEGQDSITEAKFVFGSQILHPYCLKMSFQAVSPYCSKILVEFGLSAWKEGASSTPKEYGEYLEGLALERVREGGHDEEVRPNMVTCVGLDGLKFQEKGKSGIDNINCIKLRKSYL